MRLSTFVVPSFQDMETKQVFPTDCIQQLKMLPEVIYPGTFNPCSLTASMNRGYFLPDILRRSLGEWAGRGKRWCESGTGWLLLVG